MGRGIHVNTVLAPLGMAPIGAPTDAPVGRRCERAVVTAYRELRDTGTDDFCAFRACTTLYRIHHPESSASEALRLVAEWIDHHVIREDRGPTPGCDCD